MQISQKTGSDENECSQSVWGCHPTAWRMIPTVAFNTQQRFPVHFAYLECSSNLFIQAEYLLWSGKHSSLREGDLPLMFPCLGSLSKGMDPFKIKQGDVRKSQIILTFERITLFTELPHSICLHSLLYNCVVFKDFPVCTDLVRAPSSEFLLTMQSVVEEGKKFPERSSRSKVYLCSILSSGKYL